jgi:tripartite-type tricarboxylate transporter receptor subunit TctC
MGEQGFKGVEYASWFGLLSSINVPAPLLDQINADVRKVMDSAEMRGHLDQFGIEYQSANRAQFMTVVREEVERATKVITEGKISNE